MDPVIYDGSNTFCVKDAVFPATGIRYNSCLRLQAIELAWLAVTTH